MNKPTAENALSSLVINPRINLDYLQKKINELTPESYQHDEASTFKKRICGIKSRFSYNVAINLHREGEIELKTQDQELCAYLPISVSCKVTSKKLGNTSQTLRSSFVLKVQLNFDFKNDWSFDYSIKPEFNWIKKPEVKIFGAITLRLTSKVEPIVIDLINEKVALFLDSFSIKNQLEKYLSKYALPNKISMSPPIWLQVKPNSVEFSELLEFKFQDRELLTSIRIKADLNINLTESM